REPYVTECHPAFLSATTAGLPYTHARVLEKKDTDMLACEEREKQKNFGNATEQTFEILKNRMLRHMLQ
ncbi:hypothetical protein Q6247_25815, partial [Klebsiella pneumoniae]